MSLLEWNDAFLIGVEELDFEHMDLFNRLNELHEDLIQHKDESTIDDCLGEICARVSAHFALEERFMRETKYPDYRRHKAEHDDFLEVLVEIIEEFRNNANFRYREALEQQLQRWIIQHIQTSDQKLGLRGK